jgi:hypothetical protein
MRIFSLVFIRSPARETDSESRVPNIPAVREMDIIGRLQDKFNQYLSAARGAGRVLYGDTGRFLSRRCATINRGL